MRSNIISAARSQIGIGENPSGSNRQKFGEWFGFNGAEWCGIFCSWCYFQAGYNLGHPEEKTDFYKGFASVPFAMELWQDHITKNPQPGDLVLFDWDKDGRPDHVGLFEKWIDINTGEFQTIEGNVSNMVMEKIRYTVLVECFINPKNLPPDTLNA